MRAIQTIAKRCQGHVHTETGTKACDVKERAAFCVHSHCCMFSLAAPTVCTCCNDLRHHAECIARRTKSLSSTINIIAFGVLLRRFKSTTCIVRSERMAYSYTPVRIKLAYCLRLLYLYITKRPVPLLLV